MKTLFRDLQCGRKYNDRTDTFLMYCDIYSLNISNTPHVALTYRSNGSKGLEVILPFIFFFINPSYLKIN